MSYRVTWYIEGEVIYARFTGLSNSQEVRACMNELDVYAEQAQRPLLHAVLDLSRIEKPMSLKEMGQALKGRKPDPRVGWVITVGEQSKLVKFTTSVLRQLLQFRQRSFPTMQEATDFLREIDGGINWTKADNQVFADGATASRV